MIPALSSPSHAEQQALPNHNPPIGNRTMFSTQLRMTAIALALLASGCQQQISAELSGSSLEGADAVFVRLSSVQLRKSDGSSITLELFPDAQEIIDVTQLRDGQTLELLSETDDFEGDYVGVRPLFSSTGAFVRREDGSEVTLQLLRQPEYADLSFSLERRESVALVMELALPFSVTSPTTDGGSYGLRPVVRAALRDDAGGLGGELELTLLTAESCRNGRDTGQGVAVYLFADSDRTPVDYFSSDSHTVIDQPVASAPAVFDAAAGSWHYRFEVLQPGDYTAALTCQADAENPVEQDDLEFVRQANVIISSGSDRELDFND